MGELADDQRLTVFWKRRYLLPQKLEKGSLQKEPRLVFACKHAYKLNTEGTPACSDACRQSQHRCRNMSALADLVKRMGFGRSTDSVGGRQYHQQDTKAQAVLGEY